MGTRSPTGSVDVLDEVLESGLRADYQPVVHLESGAVLGYEALARGPAGSPLETPAALFAAARAAGRAAEVDWACRAAAIAGALDDLGAVAGSLAVMPFLVPDVVKLDLTLVQQRARCDVGRIVSAVLSQAERTGASVVAEGVETEEHREAALAMGATIGQGWLFGAAEPLPAAADRLQPPEAITLLRPSTGPLGATPFAVVRGARPLRRGSKHLLSGIAAHLEEQALVWRETPVVLSSFEAGEPVGAAALDRYQKLATSGALVALLGSDVDEGVADAADVRVARLATDSPLAAEWAVVLVGAHYSGALVARCVGPDEYDFAVTHDRELVIEAGRALLRHVPIGTTSL